ncbi:MAG: response regulator [Bacteroidales bacterium]
MKILIADNNETLGELIRFKLEESGGIETTLVNDGKKALNKLNQSTFDLVITDILLPFYSGLELIHTINKRSSSNRPKIIVLTQIHNENTVTKAFELGINDYITKPCDLDFLFIQVNKLLNKTYKG